VLELNERQRAYSTPHNILLISALSGAAPLTASPIGQMYRVLIRAKTNRNMPLQCDATWASTLELGPLDRVTFGLCCALNIFLVGSSRNRIAAQIDL